VLHLALVRVVRSGGDEGMPDPAAAAVVGDDDVHQLDDLAAGQRVGAGDPQHGHPRRCTVDGGEDDPAVRVLDRGAEPLLDVVHSDRVDRPLGPPTDLPELTPECCEAGHVGERRGPGQHRASWHEWLLMPDGLG
jgi:hypothetical protein